MSADFQNVRVSREVVGKISRILSETPAVNHSLNSFTEAAVEAVIQMIESRPGERREPAIVRVFDAFREAGAPLGNQTPKAPVSSPRPYSAADAMAVASAVAGQSSPRGVPESGASPKAGGKSSDATESPRGSGRVSSPVRPLRAPEKAPRSA
jgi:hypothetical protein